MIFYLSHPIKGRNLFAHKIQPITAGKAALQFLGLYLTAKNLLRYGSGLNFMASNPIAVDTVE